MKYFFFFLLSLSLTLNSLYVEAKANDKKLFKTRWTKSLETGKPRNAYDPEESSPIAHNGIVFVGTHSGKMYALDQGNGKNIWVFESSGPISSQPLLSGNDLIFGNNKGDLYRLSGESGQIIWQNNLAGEIINQPLQINNDLYLSTSSNEIIKLNIETGRINWRQKIKVYQPKFTVRGNSKVIYEDGFLYLGLSDGAIAKLSAKNGDVVWKQVISPYHSVFKDIDFSILKDGKFLYASGYHGRLVKVNAKNGDVEWSSDISSNSSMIDYGNLIIFATPEGHVVGVDKKSSFRVWDRDIPGYLSHPELYKDKVYFTTSEGRLYILDALSGETFREEEISFSSTGRPYINDEGIYILSDDASFRFLKSLRSI